MVIRLQLSFFVKVVLSFGTQIFSKIGLFDFTILGKNVKPLLFVGDLQRVRIAGIYYRYICLFSTKKLSMDMKQIFMFVLCFRDVNLLMLRCLSTILLHQINKRSIQGAHIRVSYTSMSAMVKLCLFCTTRRKHDSSL